MADKGVAQAENEGAAERQRVVLRGLLVNVVLAAGQLAIGVIGRSAALVADGFHTLSDLLSDTLVLAAAHFGAQAADEDHPYGHARIETAGTFGLSLVLVGAGVGIALHAADALSAPARLTRPDFLALAMAFAAIGIKEGLFRYMRRAGLRLQSELLHANAWHYRTDVFSSIVVAVGVAGSMMGVRDLDAVAAIGVAILIVRMGAMLGWQAMRELVDTGLETEKLERIRHVILSIDGVRTLHLLRTRRAGGRAFIDVHILVDGTISVSEGHQISEMVRVALMRHISNIADVVVHTDSEDDEYAATNARLPLRAEVLKRLEHYFAGIEAAPAIESVVLHYLRGKIMVELRLPLDLAPTAAAARALQAQFAQAAARDPQIGFVHVCFQ
ncbi:cation diffusion facilitator family transporter [Acidiferrobacter sp.]|jgi:cation diffusion facilitator family transporter|uniref:cation diffusion facilitator family transporter n=2 Tax=Acidiferrobacter sp. TaxID=1872107 RepID=UPI0026300C53|nr:cation diffusion facilitator family transporter [Acidiferrobacter sp.]